MIKYRNLTDTKIAIILKFGALETSMLRLPDATPKVADKSENQNKIILSKKERNSFAKNV